MTRREREELLERLAVALGQEFPGCRVEAQPMPADAATIRVTKDRRVVHSVHFKRSFLEDSHDHLGLAPHVARKMRRAGPAGVWFGPEDEHG